MIMRIVSVATHKERMFDIFKLYAKKHDIPLDILVMGKKWKGFGWRWKLISEHLEKIDDNELILVKVSEKVKRGDVISTSGNSGISSGPHLHFEIWKDGEPVDPLLYFPELNKTDISVK